MSDGLPGRESGEWAKDKLYYVSRYFNAFATATKTKWPRRRYVDLLAGSGRCFLEHNKTDEFDGSPLLAATVDDPFEALLFVEGSMDLAEALVRRTTHIPTVKVLPADCNAVQTIDQVRTFLDDSLGLVFADTLGLDTVSLTTLTRLVYRRRFDLIYTFHHHDANRNLKVAMSDPSENMRFESGLGTDWRSAWHDHVFGLGNAVARMSVGEAMEGFLSERLREMGYPHVVPLPALMKNSKNSALYRLILASHDPLAVKLWNGITDIRADGQRTFRLFDR
jgi:three-Cys-motif partner protein